MAEFILKDWYGKDQTFNHETIYVRDAEGNLMPFTFGTGTSDDVRYVTFMSYDGLIEYGKKAVAVGDDCADPIARGVFSTPTRESDVQYNYTFYGWATTPNGGADANWNKAITEDKAVYANFVSAVRYYTVSFYDGDTLLHTEQVGYGGSSSYTPDAKDGYFFDTWEPAPENITGDTSCYAQWKMDVDFATASWAEIAAIAESGEAETYFALGDKKEITFEDASGNSYTINMEIWGFNHDNLSDGSGKAGISLVAEVGTIFGAKGTTSVYHWNECALRTTLNGDVFNSFATELQSVIKPVSKKYGYYDTTSSTQKIGTVTDKVWLLSAAELGFTGSATYPYVTGDGTEYAKYTRAKNNYKGSACDYWLRTGSAINSANRSAYVSSGGYCMVTTPSGSNYVVFGFCI